MSNATAWEGAVASVKYAVHIGTWTNWSRGRIMGATLTLSRTDGNYLLSFTAFFISLVSARFWRILCFIIHNRLSTQDPRDALHHQRQAILRNSSSASSGLWTLLQLTWTWRRIAGRLLARTIPIIATTIFCAAAFTVAGGFSSQISTGISNEVLLDGSHCGIVSDVALGMENDQLSYTANGLFNAANYAQQCYSANTSHTFDCTSFAKPKLPTMVDYRAPCPFADSICRSNDSNIRLDTGYIDSSQSLGINAPAGERVLFRGVLHCAPLATEQNSGNVTLPLGKYTRYFYGPSATFDDQNFTYQAEGLSLQYPNIAEDHHKGRGKNPQVAAITAIHFNGSVYDDSSDFHPIPELSRDDGDLTIAFLIANGAEYTELTADPWYRGTVPNRPWRYGNLPDSAAQMAYRPEEAASPLGCLQQFQLCNADANHCGPLTGFMDVQLQTSEIFNVSQEAEMGDDYVKDNPLGQRFQWFNTIMAYGAELELSKVLAQLGAYSLSSQSAIQDGYIGALAQNQWQVDVQRWWAIILASFQSGAVNAAVGPTEAALQPYTIAPLSAYIQETFCDNQKILSTDFTSFSLFGLYFTYILGVLIIIVSYLLEPVQVCLYRRKKLAGYACLEWATTESLQLQRAAYQGIGTGTWTGYADAVPKTEADELMGDLPSSYGDGTASTPNGEAKPEIEKVDPLPAQNPPPSPESEDSRESGSAEHSDDLSLGQQLTQTASHNGSVQEATRGSQYNVPTPTEALVSPLTPEPYPTEQSEQPGAGTAGNQTV